MIEELSSNTGTNSDEPNVRLAEKIAQTYNKKGIGELIQALSKGDKNIQSGCIKVLYEIGYRKPQLISAYVDVSIDSHAGTYRGAPLRSLNSRATGHDNS